MTNFYLTFDFKTGIRTFSLVFLFFLSSNLLGQVPTVTSFSPTSGPIGTSVTITGTNFNTTTTSNTVYFGAVKAVVTAASSTSLTVTVPISATFSPITITSNNYTAYSNKPFVVTYSNPTNIIDVASFTTTNTLITGKRPHGIASGDFNNDGKVDLVTSNYDDNTISILQNTSAIGTISFNSKVDLACGSGAFALATGDVTGDGKIDIAVANYFAGTVSVYKNTSINGTISFDSKIDYPTASGPRIVAIGDLDSDGKADLAVVNDDDGSISILRNLGTSGNISFGSKITYYPGYHPRDVVIGDLNGDNKPELVVANFSSQNAVIYKNNSTSGSISFSLNNTLSTGSSPRSIAIADLNNDGLSDLTITNHDGSSISTFKNTSSGGNMSFNSKVDFTNESNPYGVTATDLNGDGKLDLAVANLIAGSVSVFKNTSTTSAINFEPRVDFAAQSGSISIAIADLDGDGKSDIAAANDYSSNITILKYASSEVLPLNLQHFAAKPSPGGAFLTWATANESNVSHFEIQHSTDAVNFQSVGNMNATNGNGIANYSFVDKNVVTGNNYYRLKMIDNNGDYKTSSVAVADFGLDKNLFIVYPNPTSKNSINIQYQIASNAELKIVDMLGRIVKTFTIKNGTSEITVDLENVAKGTYIVILKDNQSSRTQQLIVQ